MRLYLAQHGPAMEKAQDPERPLTEEGVATIERVAAFLADGGGLRVAEVRHSGKLRARQTAEALVRELELDAPIREAPGLAPMDDVVAVVEGLRSEALDLLIVGHLPHLSRLASVLVWGDLDPDAFAFQPGGMLCLERSDEAVESVGGAAPWSVRWMIVPELIPA